MIYEEEIYALEKNLHGKKIVLMGRGEHLLIIKEILIRVGGVVCCIWDNDRSKQGGVLEGMPIMAPCSGLSESFIIIYSPRHWETMYRQVLSLGYKENAVRVLDRPSLERNRLMVMRGVEIHKGLCQAYGDDVSIFIASGPLGDYYLLSLFFFEYCRLHGIKNYVIVGDSKGIGKLSNFLGLSPVQEVSAYDTASMGELWKFVGKDKGLNIMPLTIWQGDYRLNPCVTRQLPGFTFMDTIRHMIFCLPDSVRPHYPQWHYCLERGRELFKINNLRKDKTVLLVPFAYSMVSLSREFWQRLANALHKVGYEVVVNAFGAEEKNFIEGTATLSLDFSSVMDFMEYGTVVIGIRCGFFDITSQAMCKRIILYPPNSSEKIPWQKTNIDFCGLKSMGLCENAYEWEVENVDEIQERILSVL